jgi:hypothetical protein
LIRESPYMDTHRKLFAAQQPERIRLSGQTKCKLRARFGARTTTAQAPLCGNEAVARISAAL